MEKEKIISEEKLTQLDQALAKEFKKVTVWGDEHHAFVECKGFRGPSKRVEKILADLNIKITEQQWSSGSDYSGYYYWIAE